MAMSGNKVGSSTQSYHLALNFKTEGGERSKGEEGGEEDEEEKEQKEEKEEKEEEKEGKEEDRVTPPCKTTAINSKADCGLSHCVSTVYDLCDLLSKYSSILIIIHVALLPSFRYLLGQAFTAYHLRVVHSGV